MISHTQHASSLFHADCDDYIIHILTPCEERMYSWQAHIMYASCAHRRNWKPYRLLCLRFEFRVKSADYILTIHDLDVLFYLVPCPPLRSMQHTLAHKINLFASACLLFLASDFLQSCAELVNGTNRQQIANSDRLQSSIGVERLIRPLWSLVLSPVMKQACDGANKSVHNHIIRTNMRIKKNYGNVSP